MATTPDTGRAGAVLTDPAGDLADRVREAERQLAAGEPLQAFDELAAYVRAEVADRRTMRVLALALARAGATDRAQALLEALLAEAEDPDALGVLARTWRDRWEWERDPERRRASLIRANDLYSQGFRGAQERGDLDAALYTGINAATTLLLLGHAADARDQAAMVRDLCRRRLEAGPDYWAQATLGEAALVAGDLAEAEAHYLAAVRLAGSRYGDLGTTRRQARRLLEALGMDAHVLDAALRVPRVVVFAGHMVDRPGRERPRFPAECEAAVRQAVADRLERLDAGFGFSSAASGADLLFIEAMRERRAEVTVVLPCGRDSFRRESVAIRDDGAWGERFDRILAELPVVYAGEQSETAGPAAYRYANLLQFGLGRLRADRLGTDLVGLAVWDGGPADGPAGTAAQIELWQGRGARTEIVDLALIARAAATGPARAPAGQAGDGAGDRPAGEFEQQIMAMLFADAVGYSQLSDEQVPRFVREFLGAVAELLDRSPHKPVMKNTWGDAVFFVFEDVEDAGRLSLDLRDRIRSIDWQARGLPAGLSLRIALHAGPVYGFTDPVTGARNFSGAHVSRAARIEPITPPGEVYASEPFAVLAAAQGVTAFGCDYVGQTPLAKKYGVFPTYHLRRA